MGLNQRFINVFFLLFFGERSNRVKVTNWQFPSAQHNSSTCADSDRPPGDGGPKFMFGARDLSP